VYVTKVVENVTVQLSRVDRGAAEVPFSFLKSAGTSFFPIQVELALSQTSFDSQCSQWMDAWRQVIHGSTVFELSPTFPNYILSLSTTFYLSTFNPLTLEPSTFLVTSTTYPALHN